MEDKVIVLHDEQGNEESFRVLELIPYEDKEYVVLLPVDEADMSIVVLQMESVDEENGSLIPVTDETVMEELAKIISERFAGEFDLEG